MKAPLKGTPPPCAQHYRTTRSDPEGDISKLSQKETIADLSSGALIQISLAPPQTSLLTVGLTKLLLSHVVGSPRSRSNVALLTSAWGSSLCENLTDAMIPLLNRGGMMKGFVQGADRQQTTLLPGTALMIGWTESNPVRAVDVFVDALELGELGFDGVTPAATGRPGYHPSPMLKLYIYGYLNRSNRAGGWSVRPAAIWK